MIIGSNKKSSNLYVTFYLHTFTITLKYFFCSVKVKQNGLWGMVAQLGYDHIFSLQLCVFAWMDRMDIVTR